MVSTMALPCKSCAVMWQLVSDPQHGWSATKFIKAKIIITLALPIPTRPPRHPRALQQKQLAKGTGGARCNGNGSEQPLA